MSGYSVENQGEGGESTGNPIGSLGGEYFRTPRRISRSRIFQADPSLGQGLRDSQDRSPSFEDYQTPPTSPDRLESRFGSPPRFEDSEEYHTPRSDLGKRVMFEDSGVHLTPQGWAQEDETCLMKPYSRKKQYQSTPYPRAQIDPKYSEDRREPMYNLGHVGRNEGYSDYSGQEHRGLQTPQPPPRTDSPRRQGVGSPRLNRKEKQPDKFDDKVWEWEDYLAHFLSVSRWNGWSEEEKAQQLAMSLRGKAQTLLGELSDYQLRDFDFLKSVLDRRYCPTERRSTYRNDFRYRKRRKDEGIMDYASSLRRLAAKAHPHLNPFDRDVLIVDQFTYGLSSPEIMKHVQFGHPMTLDAAIDLAIEYESFENVRANRKPQGTVSPVFSESGPTGSKQSPMDPELLRLVRTNAEAIEKLNKAVVTQNAASLDSPQRPRQNQKRPELKFNESNAKRAAAERAQAEQKEVNRQNGACFRCSEKGHFAR